MIHNPYAWLFGSHRSHYLFYIDFFKVSCQHFKIWRLLHFKNSHFQSFENVKYLALLSRFSCKATVVGGLQAMSVFSSQIPLGLFSSFCTQPGPVSIWVFYHKISCHLICIATSALWRLLSPLPYPLPTTLSYFFLSSFLSFSFSFFFLFCRF